MSPDEDSGSELEVRVIPRDRPNTKVGPLAVAMQEKLGVVEDPDERPCFAGDVEESKAGTLQLVPWRDTLPCNIFDVEPARVLDAFPKPLINEFLTHVRDVVKHRNKWDGLMTQRVPKEQPRGSNVLVRGTSAVNGNMVHLWCHRRTENLQSVETTLRWSR